MTQNWELFKCVMEKVKGKRMVGQMHIKILYKNNADTGCRCNQ